MLGRPNAVDVAFVHVDFDLERMHVDDGADAGASEAAAGRHRRDHLARLRVFRDRDAAERRANHGVGLLRFGVRYRAPGLLDLSAHGIDLLPPWSKNREIQRLFQRVDASERTVIFRLRIIQRLFSHHSF